MTELGDRTTNALRSVFGNDVGVTSITAVDEGRGVFSRVMRARLDRAPHVAAVKLVRSDANGGAALTSGAVAREVLAYEHLLPRTDGVAVPTLYGVAVDERDVPALVMQDLSTHRHEQQVDGIADRDLRAIVAELITLHSTWADHPDLDSLALRRSTPTHFAAEALERGVAALDSQWSSISNERRSALRALATETAAAVGTFTAEEGVTLCHGDPRGDNVAFDADGRAVLFDWQQIAIQFGEADLAWLLATSVTTDHRRAVEGDIIASYAMARHQDAASTWRRYVVGTVLPGLAVLMLAQRKLDDDRTEAFVRTSIERIADAVIDLRVTSVISS